MMKLVENSTFLVVSMRKLTATSTPYHTLAQRQLCLLKSSQEIPHWPVCVFQICCYLTLSACQKAEMLPTSGGVGSGLWQGQNNSTCQESVSKSVYDSQYH